MKRTLVILGHPNAASLCGALATAYVEAAQQANAEVKLLRLGSIKFDPILWHGHVDNQPLEPDLVAAQEAITWAEHLVFVYPTWWGALPALLKGFIDRVFLPGFAYKYRADSQWWDRLLAGRSARLIVTMDFPPWYYRLFYGRPGHRQMKGAILEFSGIKPVAITSFGPVHGSQPEQREKWLATVRALGAKTA